MVRLSGVEHPAPDVFEMETEESTHRAFDVLHDGGVTLEAIHALPWSSYCATVIDRYPVWRMLVDFY